MYVYMEGCRALCVTRLVRVRDVFLSYVGERERCDEHATQT